jgi:hypothetical protein
LSSYTYQKREWICRRRRDWCEQRSGAELDAKAMERTGKTMEQLTEEKRKEVRQYEKDWGNEHTKQRPNQILP